MNDTHERLQPNGDFLSPEEFSNFETRIAPMSSNVTAIMLEFECQRKEKIASLELFLRKLETFILNIPRTVPLAVETRNANYFCEEYFSFF